MVGQGLSRSAAAGAALIRLRTRVLGLCVSSVVAAPAFVAAQQTVDLPARDKRLTETAAVLYTVGSDEGEDWQLLSGVRSVAFDAVDDLYVLDGNNFRILVFDAAGKYLRTISRKGDGPGELMAPVALTVLSDGTIAAGDLVRRTFSLFRTDGTFVGDVSFPAPEGMGGLQPILHAHPLRGVVALMFVRPPPRADPTVPTGERTARAEWFDFATAAITPASPQDAEKALSLYAFTVPSITPVTRVQDGHLRGISTVPPHWTPPMAFAVLADGGLAVVHDPRYRVEVISPAGKLERTLVRPLAPRKGTLKDKEAFIRSERRNPDPRMQLSRNGGGASIATPEVPIDEAVRNATWMETIPVLRGVSADRAGRIWIARTPADFDVQGPVDIVRANGSYIGTIAHSALPGAFSSSGRAAYIERDALGVEHVTVKQLPAGWK